MSQECKARLLVCCALLCVGTAVFGLFSALQRGLHSDKAFAQDLIRLHVVAHSNLPQDQELKLKVRDAVLLETKRILGEVAERDQAYTLLVHNLQTLERSAQEAVWASGYDYPVAIKLGSYLFPERDYGELLLPQGAHIGGCGLGGWAQIAAQYLAHILQLLGQVFNVCLPFDCGLNVVFDFWIGHGGLLFFVKNAYFWRVQT